LVVPHTRTLAVILVPPPARGGVVECVGASGELRYRSLGHRQRRYEHQKQVSASGGYQDSADFDFPDPISEPIS